MIKDSGERREFETGAVRDCSHGKGRCDLMPMDVVYEMADNVLLGYIASYMNNGNSGAIKYAIDVLVNEEFPTEYHATLELSKHFENGALKYGEYNWQKGIETRSYIDSAIRHYCKHKAGYTDEPHAVACLWNLVCCLWTLKHKPELNSFPVYPVEREEKSNG